MFYILEIGFKYHFLMNTGDNKMTLTKKELLKLLENVNDDTHIKFTESLCGNNEYFIINEAHFDTKEFFNEYYNTLYIPIIKE